MKKRLTAMLFILVMLSAMLPVTAYAGDAKDVTITVYHYMTQATKQAGLDAVEKAFADEHPEFRKLAISWADWLIHDLPKTEEGGFQHVTSGSEDGKSLILNEQQLWVDTLFMAVLFLNRMGQKYGREDWVDESIHQVLMHIRYLCDPQTGLFYHGWTFNGRNHFGGIFWCRGDSKSSFSADRRILKSQRSRVTAACSCAI